MTVIMIIVMMQARVPQRMGLRGRQRGLPEPGIHRGSGLYSQVSNSAIRCENC